MQKTILVIDDDDALRASLARALRQNNFIVLTASGTATADDIMQRVSVDAIVLDRMMPDEDGMTALLRWRKTGQNVPVIMLTAMSGPENTIDGLSGGADDYLAKPFQLKELVLRLNNIIQRRSDNIIPLPQGLRLIDGQFFIDGKLLALSAAECSLMRALVSPVGNTVPAAPMVAKRLRQKLLNSMDNLDILTIRAQGYKLVVKN